MQLVQSNGADKPLFLCFVLFFFPLFSTLVCFICIFLFAGSVESWRQIGYIQGTNLFFFLNTYSAVTLCKQSLHSRKYKRTNRGLFHIFWNLKKKGGHKPLKKKKKVHQTVDEGGEKQKHRLRRAVLTVRSH